MEKRFYYSPEMKFHQLKAKAAMLAGSLQESEQGENDEEPSKACSLFFEEDED